MLLPLPLFLQDSRDECRLQARIFQAKATMYLDLHALRPRVGIAEEDRLVWNPDIIWALKLVSPTTDALVGFG